MHMKVMSAKWRPFCPGGAGLIRAHASSSNWFDPTISTSLSVIFRGYLPEIPLLTWFNAKSSISNHMSSRIWDDLGITYLLSNFNGYTVNVWEWISNFILHFIMDVISYPQAKRDQW